MKKAIPKIGDVFWGSYEHPYYNERGFVEIEYVVYPCTVKRIVKGGYITMMLVGQGVDGYQKVHWFKISEIGSRVFDNPKDAALLAANESDYRDQHYRFRDTSPLIRRTQWQHLLEENTYTSNTENRVSRDDKIRPIWYNKVIVRRRGCRS